MACNASGLALAEQLNDEDMFVAMMIGDEVHGTESDGFKDAYNALNPRCAVGFTATPYRSNEQETLSLWTSVRTPMVSPKPWQMGVIVP